MKRVANLLVAGALAVLGACGGPALAGVPHPNNAAVAGVAAAVAGAITLANPNAAVRKPEADVDKDSRPVPVHETVPSDVFDRAENPPPPDLSVPPPIAPPSNAPGATGAPGAQGPMHSAQPGDPTLQP